MAGSAPRGVVQACTGSHDGGQHTVGCPPPSVVANIKYQGLLARAGGVEVAFKHLKRWLIHALNVDVAHATVGCLFDEFGRGPSPGFITQLSFLAPRNGCEQGGDFCFSSKNGHGDFIANGPLQQLTKRGARDGRKVHHDKLIPGFQGWGGGGRRTERNDFGKFNPVWGQLAVNAQTSRGSPSPEGTSDGDRTPI